MWCTIELSDIHDVAFIFEHGGLVVVNVEIIRGREDRHNRREASSLRFAIHAITKQV